MNTRVKTTILAFSLVSLLASSFADAARMGSRRSHGMRRAAPTQTYQAPVQQQAMPAAAAQQRKSGPGVGTAVAAGVAGAAAGYMIGSSMNNGHTSQASAPVAAAQATQAAKAPAERPAIPWTLISILGLAFVVGLIWFRRRVGMPNGAPAAMTPPNLQTRDNPFAPAENNRFPPIPQAGSGFPGAAPQLQPLDAGIRRLPDGTETPYFLRQAKATFLHLQSLNSPDTLDEVRRYMTPELFEELRGDIGRNSEYADFPQLDCQLIEATEEEGNYVASVRFSGLVSEAVNAQAEPFTETWHFVKDAGSGMSAKWMVAGIQQS